VCASTADIKSATAEIGKKKIYIEEETTGQKYNGLPSSAPFHRAAIKRS